MAGEGRAAVARVAARTAGALRVVGGRFLGGVTLGAMLATAIVLWATDQYSGEARAQNEAPGEYLYLDKDRVNAYLGQISGGLSVSEERSKTNTRNAEVSLKAGELFGVNGSRQEQDFVRRVVTPTAADRFYTLLRALKDNGWLKVLNVGTTRDRGRALAAKLRHLDEGDFVELNHAHLEIPPYAALFPKANYARQDLRSGLQNLPARVLAPTSKEGITQLRAFFDDVGTDPRLPFRVYAQLPGGPSAEIFAPLASSKLAPEPGLMSGGVKIVAKVIRVIALPGPRDPDANEHGYVDIQTLTAYGRAIRYAPRDVLARLNVASAMSARNATIRQAIRRSATIALERGLDGIAFGLVLAPIAVYE